MIGDEYLIDNRSTAMPHLIQHLPIAAGVAFFPLLERVCLDFIAPDDNHDDALPTGMIFVGSRTEGLPLTVLDILNEIHLVIGEQMIFIKSCGPSDVDFPPDYFVCHLAVELDLADGRSIRAAGSDDTSEGDVCSCSDNAEDDDDDVDSEGSEGSDPC